MAKPKKILNFTALSPGKNLPNSAVNCWQKAEKFILRVELPIVNIPIKTVSKDRLLRLCLTISLYLAMAEGRRCNKTILKTKKPYPQIKSRTKKNRKKNPIKKKKKKTPKRNLRL